MSELKSAYEAALERLDSQGVEHPREDSLSKETLEKIAGARQRTEARLAELEILHRDRLAKIEDPAAAQQEREEYRHDRSRLEAKLESELGTLRAGG